MANTRFVVRCGDHPLYRAIFRPRADCETCGILWNMVNNPEFPVCEVDLITDQYNQADLEERNENDSRNRDL